jgi:hypothetical protein
MKKSKGKWTKKRGGFLGFSVPDFGISSFFGYTKPDTPATGTTSITTQNATQSSGALQSSGANQTATGTNSVTTKQSTGATQTNNTLGGSRRKRKTKKSKK